MTKIMNKFNKFTLFIISVAIFHNISLAQFIAFRYFFLFLLKKEQKAMLQAHFVL